MVYNYNLPTTSHLSFQNYIYSNTHPSLPQAASTARHALRIALKTHKRLSVREQENNLLVVLNALNEYIPYLFAINDGLSGRSIRTGGGVDEEETIDITLKEELVVEWRPVLISSLSSIVKSAGTGNANHRIKGRGVDFEIAFVVGTLGYVLSNLARVTVLRILYASSTPTAEQRAAAMQNATKYLLQASSAHTLLAKSFTISDEAAGAQVNYVPQLNTTVQTALATLALAEATLLAVLKDDAYTFACIQARNPNDKEWMVRAPEIPKVRALLLARLCVRSAEHAEQAFSGLGSAGASRSSTSSAAAAKIDEDLVKYVQTVIKVSRAKACRFFAIDAELSSKVGEAIAWLRAGKGALGIKRALVPEGQSTAGKSGTFSKLKKEWSDRRDERRLVKSSSNAGTSGIVQGDELSRGDDAGWEEEGRVIETLELKWVKMNNTINTQTIPPSEPLLSNLPSGRDIHAAPPSYKPPSLEESELIRMRAPPEKIDQSLSAMTLEDDSEDEVTPAAERGLPGGFLSSRSATADSYY
ncbi:pH-signaling protein PalC, putative [Talaromyces stipitatus ATCC 10500]|uniref:pH-response regulator protein palC n=1 Tax=Talaromyces stipitatus (strain ATCC 10500 / CBS 375.48 / QM 6759 / NRRL 1006) TaxID=441959 RepID=B8MRS5_TALSN|nr:pH-signaling protein PalC, putative [Talaromyces stipitatus ATCC 10500]EED13259.1 pH-signaling protein PalC, putative [Talaromyces stipitatus ATCC 10500]